MEKNNLEQEILDSVEEAAKAGTKFFVVDNITFICNDSEKGATAGSFMVKLIRLKKKYNLTTIVIAHTPKRRGCEPITQNDLAGSAKLINFFDAGIALARSARDNNLRYLKQVKVRTGECPLYRASYQRRFNQNSNHMGTLSAQTAGSAPTRVGTHSMPIWRTPSEEISRQRRMPR